jgi:hypothetical protein
MTDFVGEKMICPRCTSPLHWQSDFMCDEMYGCVCEKGVVGIYNCPYCKAHVEITTDCEGDICE